MKEDTPQQPEPEADAWPLRPEWEPTAPRLSFQLDYYTEEGSPIGLTPNSCTPGPQFAPTWSRDTEHFTAKFDRLRSALDYDGGPQFILSKAKFAQHLLTHMSTVPRVKGAWTLEIKTQDLAVQEGATEIMPWYDAAVQHILQSCCRGGFDISVRVIATTVPYQAFLQLRKPGVSHVGRVIVITPRPRAIVNLPERE